MCEIDKGNRADTVTKRSVDPRTLTSSVLPWALPGASKWKGTVRMISSVCYLDEREIQIAHHSRFQSVAVTSRVSAKLQLVAEVQRVRRLLAVIRDSTEDGAFARHKRPSTIPDIGSCSLVWKRLLSISVTRRWIICGLCRRR